MTALYYLMIAVVTAAIIKIGLIALDYINQLAVSSWNEFVSMIWSLI